MPRLQFKVSFAVAERSDAADITVRFEVPHSLEQHAMAFVDWTTFLNSFEDVKLDSCDIRGAFTHVQTVRDATGRLMHGVEVMLVNPRIPLTLKALVHDLFHINQAIFALPHWVESK